MRSAVHSIRHGIRSFRRATYSVGRRVAPLLTALTILPVTTGCDIPTSLPRWETEWELVVARDGVTTAELLPEEMRVTPEGLALDSFVVRDSVLLGDVCELCTCFSGPIPRLELEATDQALGLPYRLLQADLERGAAFLRLTNGLGFDLLDDGLGNRGVLRARLIDRRTGVTLVDRVTVGPFPPGRTLSFEFPLAGVRAHSDLIARVSGSTPGSSCEDLSLDPNDGLGVELELSELETDAATVLVLASDLSVPDRRGALPAEISKRLADDAADLVAELDVINSLGLPLNLDLSVAARVGDLWTAAAALTTPVEIAAGSTGRPTRVVRHYVIDGSMLATADSIVVAARASLPDGGIVEIRGDEGISWDLRIRARVPSR